jgi:hyperpolarization activated cyclic nucleotide-gated potassium channel 1
MPYRMAFEESEMWTDWFYVELTIDSLFFVDVVVNCLSAYYNSDGHLVTSRSRILVNYARSWMVLDLIA